MNIFDQDRVGKIVRCDLVHVGTGEERTGSIAWHLAIVGETSTRMLANGCGYLPGPWTVVSVDV